MTDKMRTFDTGAIRSDDLDKLDYEACLSPLVLQRYTEYIRSHRKLPDGSLRSDDNWQKGFGLKRWMKAKWRHFMASWSCYRAPVLLYPALEESLCAELFNTMGMLHEILKGDTEVSANHKSLVGLKEIDVARNFIGLLRGLLAFVRRVGALECISGEMTEHAMQYEANIEAILEMELYQIAEGISNAGTGTKKE